MDLPFLHYLNKIDICTGNQVDTEQTAGADGERHRPAHR
jgi:hypothetical protein